MPTQSREHGTHGRKTVIAGTVGHEIAVGLAWPVTLNVAPGILIIMEFGEPDGVAKSPLLAHHREGPSDECSFRARRDVARCLLLNSNACERRAVCTK
jgi:hypothetical protein